MHSHSLAMTIYAHTCQWQCVMWHVINTYACVYLLLFNKPTHLLSLYFKTNTTYTVVGDASDDKVGGVKGKGWLRVVQTYQRRKQTFKTLYNDMIMITQKRNHNWATNLLWCVSLVHRITKITTVISDRKWKFCTFKNFLCTITARCGLRAPNFMAQKLLHAAACWTLNLALSLPWNFLGFSLLLDFQNSFTPLIIMHYTTVHTSMYI